MADAMGKLDQMVGIPIERRILAEFFCIIQPAIDSDRLLLLAERLTWGLLRILNGLKLHTWYHGPKDQNLDSAKL
ncbi:hypothetical protein CFC21_069175 [Triticum aestivum]|uniref:Uncharacterized protein n=2 Tax=Triticum aestivum TaxID=4565 RepID=A0A9R1KQG5_WHEAT|nr:hypothetical protein CFC21_069175 [Triticum aestivum]